MNDPVQNSNAYQSATTSNRYSDHKINVDYKIASEKKLSHALSNETPHVENKVFQKKRNSEPKVLFGVSPQIPPLPPSRVRKGAPIEKSRNAKNPIRPKQPITEEDQKLVADLPDSDSDDGSGCVIDEGKKSGIVNFKLKEVDDKEVLRRYEELVEGK